MFAAFAGPYLAGWVRTYAAGFGVVLAILGGFLALSAVINLAVAYADDRRREPKQVFATRSPPPPSRP